MEKSLLNDFLLQEIINSNKTHTEHLTNDLISHYKDLKDKWRVYAYNKAISSIKSYNREITSKEQALTITGVGNAIADKIDEFLQTKSMKKVEKVKEEVEKIDEKSKIINEFLNIWGVGEVKADELYKKVGVNYNADDLADRFTETLQIAISNK